MRSGSAGRSWNRSRLHRNHPAGYPALIEPLEPRQLLAAQPLDVAPPARPNFLFVYTDDQRWDAMSVVQQEEGAAARFPWLRTPNMDRLAAESVRMRNAFVVDSLCSPSRASFLTSQYSHFNGVEDNETEFPTDSVTYATLLQQAGYKTGFVGKWHMDSQTARPGFDYSASFNGQGQYFDGNYEVNGQTVKTNGWVDDVTTNYAIDFLKAQQQGNPFLLTVGFKSPHTPWGPPPQFANALANDTAAPAPNANFPPPYLSKGGHTLSTAKTRNYFRTIMGADADLGRLLDTLDQLNLSSNTVVIFTTDNGYYIGDHGLTDKRSAYDESMRVPMLVRIPGVTQPGTTADQMVLNLDIAPTILSLAGVAVPSQMQGRSMVPLFSGQTADWRTSWFYEYFQEQGFAPPKGPPSIFAVRTDTAKLVKWAGHPEWTQLFDLANDPLEEHNLFNTPAATSLQQQMLSAFDQSAAAAGLPAPPGLGVANLQAGVTSVKLADSVPYGTMIKGSITVRISNSGDLPLDDHVPISIRLTQADLPTTSDPEILQTIESLRLKPGRSKKLKIRFSELPVVPPGDYRVGVLVDPANVIVEESDMDNAAADPALHHVAAPALDLSGDFRSFPPALMVAKKEQATIDISNGGNIPAVGDLFVALSASSAPSPDGAAPLGTFRVKLKLKPLASKGYKLKFIPPATLSPGSYYLLAQLDTANAFAETDETNNLLTAGPVPVS